jgi:hypothetical protein
MFLETLFFLAGILAMGIEGAYVPTEGGGGDYLVRVEPDLMRNGTQASPLTSDVPADARDVRRVKIFVSDTWPAGVDRLVSDAAKRPRAERTSQKTSLLSGGEAGATGGAVIDRPWPLLIGSLLTLFLSLGANAYLGLLLASMRQRYLRDVQQGVAVR